jgi:hypothetical protein
VLFALFGLWLLFDVALGWQLVAVVVTAVTAAAAVFAGVASAVRRRDASV